MNIAIFSPSQNPYSETFIQAHKERLKGKIFYYYGLGLQMKLEGHDKAINTKNNATKILDRLLGRKYSEVKWKGLISSINENKIDVILVEYGNHAFHLLGFLNKVKIPFVVHFHGYDASVSSTIKSCNNYREVFEKASKIISVSSIMSKKLLDMGCSKEKLSYNVYGPNPDFEKVRATFSKQQFIAVGRFTDKKAPYYLILSFLEVVLKYPEATLLIAGNGPLFNTCKNLINHYRLEDNIKLLGVIKPDVYQQLLEESLAFVQHSIISHIGDMEGTPLAILEASIAGLPIISTYHAGIPDVIINGETGILVEEHDVYGMSQAMIELCDNKELAIQLGAKGKLNISNNFSMKKHIDNLDNILKSASQNKY